MVHKTTGRPDRIGDRRFQYPPQEIEIGRSGNVVLQSGEHYGTIEGHDRAARTIDLKSKSACHPTTVFSKDVVNQEQPQKSVIRLAERLLQGGVDRMRPGPAGAATASPGARRPSRSRPDELPADMAVRLVTNLRQTALAIQGPPGAGKTFTGARMVLALVRAGKRVGITATSHKVIRQPLDRSARAGAGREASICGWAANRRQRERRGHADPAISGQRCVDGGAPVGQRPGVRRYGMAVVAGGGASAVDVLFVDEAGQMSLANVLAVSQAADSLVLLGDPQQLDQPQKASHPDGVGISALEHVLDGAETMPDDRGIFLPATYRMSPAITRFTSELFYEGKLQAEPALAAQALEGTGRFDGSGLWLVPVDHDGNQNASAEEVTPSRSVASLLRGLAREWIAAEALRRRWHRNGCHGARPHCIDGSCVGTRSTGADIKVVAPFNAQVNRLAERLAPHGVPRRHRGQVPGQTARGRHLLDDDITARGRAARDGVPLQPQSAQRRDLTRALRGVRRMLAAAAGARMPHAAADASGKCPVPLRGNGHVVRNPAAVTSFPVHAAPGRAVRRSSGRRPRPAGR